MKYGMTEEQFAILDQLVIQPLRTHGAEVFIFGSRALGTNHPHSDVDLLFKSNVTEKIPANKIAVLKEAIEESKFPFTVDLVDDSELAESYRPQVIASIKPI